MNDSSRPEFWDERYAGQLMPWDFGGVPSALRDFLSREKPGKVLIPGCGPGYEVPAFARSGWQVDAVDFSLEAISHARKFLGEDARFVRQADFFADNPNGPFDLVYERTFLCSLPKTLWPSYAAQIAQSLRTGGCLVGFFFFGPEPERPPYPLRPRRTSRPFRRAFHANRKRLGIGFPAVFRRQGELADLEEDMKTFAVNRHRGILSALGSALLFGASTPLAKLAVSSADPLLIAGLLYLGSGIGLAISRTIRAGPLTKRTETPLSRADLPWLAGATLAGGVAGPALLLLGLLTTQASTASLLLNLEAVATAAIAWVIFRENVDKRVGAGFALILLGGIFLSLPQEGGLAVSSGALLIAAACLCWGIDNNLTRKISGSDPSQIAMWKGLTAGIVNTGLALAIGAKLPAINVTLGVALIGFLGYGVSLVLFVQALRHLGTARTGAYFSTAPFAGAALAFALGQGRLDWAFWLAGILMLIGVLLHVTERHEHGHVHEPMEHQHLHYHDEHHQHEHAPGVPPGEPHAHRHRHARLTHAHPHYPDIHHRHEH